MQEARDTTEHRDAIRSVLAGFDKLRLEKVGTDARAMKASPGNGHQAYELRLAVQTEIRRLERDGFIEPWKRRASLLNEAKKPL